MKKLSIVLAAMSLSGPAVAGGLGEPSTEVAIAPAPAPMMVTNDWTGGYAGVQLGYGNVSNDLNGDGWLGGVHAGYRWDLGSYVLGTELDYDSTDIDLGGADSLDSVTRLKLSAGYDAGNVLLYGTGGAAWAKADVGAASLSDNGWFLGAGMAYQLTNQWTVGAEVLGHRFEDFDGTGVDVDATTATLRASFRF